MNGGFPPKPTLRHMFAGIALTVILLLAFLKIPVIVKWVGETLTFIPSQLGLIQIVSPSEVMPVDIQSTPTAVTFSKPGSYLLYTDDYDLLVINDSIIASRSRPWINIHSPSGESVPVDLIARGLAIYDTPFARGRPVASFEIVSPGVYIIEHPRRQIYIYIVPDYLSGKEGLITFFMVLEVVIITWAIWYFTRRKRKKKNWLIRPPQRP
jgi:hypothetical protein